MVKEMREFGKKVAEKRQAVLLDKKQFAVKCGMSYKHYFNIESGETRPSMQAYISICRALGLAIPLVG